MEEYDVLLNGSETSCTCPGHTYRGKCKHVSALLTLTSAGKLPAPKQPETPIAEEKPTQREPYCKRCNDAPHGCIHCTL